nr:uncharacterized protein LOC109152759 [Ipomoea batatas]
MKRVEVDPSCPKCGLEHEDTMHALVLCDYSQLIWHASSLNLSSISSDAFSGWFTNVMLALTEDNVAFVVAALYYMWRARNSAVWERTLPTPSKVLKQAAAALRAWRTVHGLAQKVSAPSQPAAHSALVDDTAHAPSHSLRCFFDAAYHPNTMTASFGAVLLAQDRAFHAACAGNLPGFFAPLMAKAAACNEVLAGLKGKGVLEVQLLTDCMQLRSGLVIQQSSFRSANTIAHTLASSVITQSTNMYWDLVPPDYISTLLH